MGSSLEEVIFKLNPDERIALVKGMAARDGGARERGREGGREDYSRQREQHVLRTSLQGLMGCDKRCIIYPKGN